MRFYVPRFLGATRGVSPPRRSFTRDAASETFVLFQLYFPGTQFASRRNGAGRLGIYGNACMRDIGRRRGACGGAWATENCLCRGFERQKAARGGGNAEVWRACRYAVGGGTREQGRVGAADRRCRNGRNTL